MTIHKEAFLAWVFENKGQGWEEVINHLADRIDELQKRVEGMEKFFGGYAPMGLKIVKIPEIEMCPHCECNAPCDCQERKS